MKELTMYVHDGTFHADDVYSCALMKMYAESCAMHFSVVRLERNKPIPEMVIGTDSDIIVADIGCGEFDHHQDDARVRPTGEKYAAFGLLFKKYWNEFFDEKTAADKFDKEFIIPIDLCDNFGPSKYPSERSEDIAYMNNCKPSDTSVQYNRFMHAVSIAEDILTAQFDTRNRTALQAKDVANFIKFDETIEIAHFDHFVPAYLFKGSNVKFVIMPREEAGADVKWNLISVDSEKYPCLSKEDLGDDLKDLCTFVHPNKFMSIFQSFQAADLAANKALIAIKNK